MTGDAWENSFDDVPDAEIRLKPPDVKPKIFLDPGEQLLGETASRYREGLESGTGRMFLTSRRLVWSAGPRSNLGVEVLIPLEAVAAVTPGWSRLMEVVPFIPDTVLVTDVHATQYHFAVVRRRAWVQMISDAVRARRA